MSLATVDELRALIYTKQTDDELSAIISVADSSLSGMGLSSSHARYKELHLYKAVILCLQRMQTNSELAYMVKHGGVQQMNSDAIKLIETYTKLFESTLKSVQITTSLLSPTYVISHQRESDYYE